MPTLKNFTRRDHVEAVRLLKDGVSKADVAKKFGVKVDTIYRLEKRMGYVGKAVVAKSKAITVRLSAEEYRAFLELMERGGYKNNADFCRALVRSAAGFVEIAGESTKELETISREVSKIGVNINQIARAANSKKVHLVDRQWEDIRELRSRLPELRSRLKAVVSEARRKGAQLWRKSEFGT
jgi:transposase